MGAREKVIRDIEALKNDTNKVIRDLTLLSSSLAGSATSEVSRRVDSAQARTEKELKKIRIRLGKLNRELTANAKKVDENIHDNPYPWVAGALGFGWLVGRLARRGDR